MSSDPAARYRALLARELSREEAQAVKAELQDDESPLSRHLAGLDPDDVERALLEAQAKDDPMSPLSPREADALFARIERAVAAPRPSLLDRLRALFEWRSAGLGLAVGAAVATLALVALPTLSMREKGDRPIVSPRLELVFHVGRHEPNRPLVVERGAPGARYAADSDILLSWEIAADGHVCLAHRVPSKRLEALSPGAERESAGRHELRRDGRVQAVRLSDGAGKYEFFAVWSEAPLACPAVVDDALLGRRADLVVDSFEVEVPP